ncbi:2TM domain-containing protein [Portibacter marinus]|uniref:2TM domain-containing protein n=1 Tax=Portibacter marinus TaxID=2898660 RepID=UPI001F1B2132|nr:2TM domain-containing protein [Portibacter marinus]
MADKNYVKALRRAKAKKAFYSSLIAFVPIGFMLFILNVSLIAPNVPWSLFPILGFIVILVIQRLMMFKRPQKTIFSDDYLEYQTEKEMRLIEFEDDMDDLEAEKLQLKNLELHPLSRKDNELV